MTTAVLSLNSGSSTLKAALYRCDAQGARELFRETLRTGAGAQAVALEQVLARVRGTAELPQAVGHRLVHGGARFDGPVAVDTGVLARLDELGPLAPLHLPPALGVLRRALEQLPQALHVASFDTAFHRTLPQTAQRFALPEALHLAGVRRYGFHGLSCQSALAALGTPPPERLIVAHLGSGASLTAIAGGRSLDTSMGLTPAGGIPMGTRSGDLDPGVLLFLMRERGLGRDELEALVNHQAGLLGVGGSADMSELLRREAAGDERARLAIELFSYAIKKQIGAYTAALGGLDCLVFTGGIGEHAPRVRALCCQGLQALGIELDASKNEAGAALISPASARCQVRVIAANEDLVLAREAYALWQELRG